MKKVFYYALMFTAVGVTSACSGDKDNTEDNNNETVEVSNGVDTTAFLADLKALEESLNSAEKMPAEKDLKEALVAFQDFVGLYPNDPKAPDYLLKASDIALTLDQPKKSVKLLNRIIEEYPDYDRMESVEYNRASHLDFELRDTTKAKEAYSEFIDTYPNSPLVNDCKSRIENIKYTEEELVEKFMKDLENQKTN